MHPDVTAEQAYFDTALEHRERARAQLDRAPDLSSDPTTAAELRRRLGAMGLVDPDEGVAFGRIDRGSERIYIGKNAIWDDHNELLVINWQAPAARPFYTSTPRSPQGLNARRTFLCESNKILDIEELLFRGLSEAVANGTAPDRPVLGDALLESLGRNRSGELGDIVATIQTAQYDIVSKPIEQLLVVQGGPGTGKTVVGLHRVSWLLYNLHERLRSDDVLVVGPNPAFVRYIRAVLPKLGDEAVIQRSVTELGPRVRGGRVEPPMTRKVKGDRRMIELIVRGLRNRQRIDASPIVLDVGGRRVTLDSELVAARATQLDRRPHNEAHAGLREFLVQEVQAYLGRRGVFDTGSLANVGRGASGKDIDNYLERVWPKLTPQAFVLDLLSTRSRLDQAAKGLFDPNEVTLLTIPRDARVGSWEWSLDDIPILDAADFLLNGPQRTYEYIVVDEAQDLSPMQLLSIARRSRNGWMTVLGDLAQATSPAALGSWNEVADHLYRRDVPADLAELQLGYRLPTEVHEVAMRLLRRIAPGLATPESVRPSGHDVLVARADSGEIAKTVVATIRPFLGTGLIGIITPDGVRDRVTAALDAEGLFWAPELQAAAAPIVVMSAEAAKGLEFDNVVVVEPVGILDDYGNNGKRALFVALTRCTRRLAIVHQAPIPPVLGLRDAAGDPGDFRDAAGSTGDTGDTGDPGGTGGTGGTGGDLAEADKPEVPSNGISNLSATLAALADESAASAASVSAPSAASLASERLSFSRRGDESGEQADDLGFGVGSSLDPTGAADWGTAISGADPTGSVVRSPLSAASAFLAGSRAGRAATATSGSGPTPGAAAAGAVPSGAGVGGVGDPGASGPGHRASRAGAAGPGTSGAGTSGAGSDAPGTRPTEIPGSGAGHRGEPGIGGEDPRRGRQAATGDPAFGVTAADEGGPGGAGAAIARGPASPAAAPSGQGGAGSELWVASPVVAAIAESLITTLDRMVQPALVPEVVEQLRRIADERYSTGPPGGVPVHLPAELVERANRAVADGLAGSLSEYIATALDDKQRLQEVAGHVNQMLADAGGPLPSTEPADDPDGAD